MFDFSQLFLYVPGAIIFLVGSSSVRVERRMKKLGACTEATVVSCNHVLKKDRKGREVYNYYNVVVEYFNGQNMERETVKEPNEYSVGQQVKLYRDQAKGESTLVQQENESLFGPWPTTIGGALLILLALLENQGKEISAMITLVVVLAGAGAILLRYYYQMKSRNLEKVEAEITGVFTRQISKETKILRGSKFTYYPIVKYILNGKENIRRCNINSSQERDFKVGEHMTLYYDPKRHLVIEQHAKKSVLIWGVVLLAVGLLAGASILAQWVLSI